MKILLNLGIAIIIIGFLFKIQHWPFQNELITIGASLIFFYGILFFRLKLKEHDKILLKIADYIGLFIVISFSFGLITHFYNLEISYYLIIALVSLIGIFLPFLTIIIVKYKENRKFRIKWLIILFLYFSANIYFSFFHTEKDVLNAFVEIDKGITNTNQLITSKSDSLYQLIDSTDSNYEFTLNLRASTDSLTNLIESLKKRIVISENVDSIFFKQSYASTLKTEINKYREYCLSLNISEEKKQEIEMSLSTNEIKTTDGYESWEKANFEHLPIAAIIAILSGIENAIIDTENMILEEFTQANKASNPIAAGVSWDTDVDS